MYELYQVRFTKGGEELDVAVEAKDWRQAYRETFDYFGFPVTIISVIHMDSMEFHYNIVPVDVAQTVSVTHLM